MVNKPTKMITQTLVFHFESEEQRQEFLEPLWPLVTSDEFPRISALSLSNEHQRAELMFEALERYYDDDDLRRAIAALAEEMDIDNWSWDKYDSETI